MVRLYLGKLLNALGIGALIQACEYRSDVTGATAKVELRELFTIITVNGCDVYFSRTTGKIDGVVPNPNSVVHKGEVEFISDPERQSAETPQEVELTKSHSDAA